MQRTFVLVLLLLVSHSSPLGAANQAALQLHFLDVGYGDAILIEMPDGHVMLVDAGDLEHGPVLQDYLREEGVWKIDTVIITHPHVNHFGGLFDILDDIKINRLLINGDSQVEDPFFELVALLDMKKVHIQVLEQGSVIKDLPEDIRIQVLHPRSLTSHVNDNSLVLKIIYGQTSFLLTGDIGPEVQNGLIDGMSDLLAADVVQIPHHGGPISEKFAKFFGDATFVISTGPNEWGLPRPKELETIGGKLLRTDEDGNILFESNGEKWSVVTTSQSSHAAA